MPKPQEGVTPRVTDEAVEAAAAAAMEKHHFRPYDATTRTMLEAAYPHLLAASRKPVEEELDLARRHAEEAEDRFESCENCERPSREEDLKVIWAREPESGEQVDARICLVCRLEAERDEQLRERLLSDEAVVALARRRFEAGDRNPDGKRWINVTRPVLDELTKEAEADLEAALASPENDEGVER
jgi:hypothetical protein